MKGWMDEWQNALLDFMHSIGVIFMQRSQLYGVKFCTSSSASVEQKKKKDKYKRIRKKVQQNKTKIPL